MNHQSKIIKPIFNPALEILPLILFLALGYFTPFFVAFSAAIAFFLVYLFFAVKILGYNPPYLLLATGVVIVLDAIASHIPPINSIPIEYSTILCEVLLIITFSVMSLIRKPLREALKMKYKTKNPIKLALFDEAFSIARIFRAVLILHLMIVPVYRSLPIHYRNMSLDMIIIPGLFFLFIATVIIYEIIRFCYLKQKIEAEDWLPIVNETGGVVGKIAYSISRSSKKPYMHPVIRITVFHKGLLFLKERPDNYVLDPGKVDYPFEKFVFYNMDLESTVDKALKKVFGDKDVPVKFVFRYLFKNETSTRLNYLYTCVINDEETFKQLSQNGGKLWTDNQIGENINKGIFSEAFEKEYEILKDTVLMVEKMVYDIDSAKKS